MFPLSPSVRVIETNLDTKTPEAHVKRSILVRTVETRDGEVCVFTEWHPLAAKRANLHIAPLTQSLWGAMLNAPAGFFKNYSLWLIAPDALFN